MDRGPIFVAGIERSGTSLMYALLASHPALAMTRRTNLWRYVYNRFGDLGQSENFERCLSWMRRYKRLRVLELDSERIRREFWEGEPSYARLIRLLVAHHLERMGKPRWGDKSLNTERYLDYVFAAYPTAQIIHMIRDPRDRYASARTRWRAGRGGAGTGTARWLASMSLAKQNLRRYPDRYKVVSYEALSADPVATLQDICAFLGEEYTPAMLSMEGAGTFREKGSNSSYGRGESGLISTRSIGRFRQVLSKQEIAFVQACTRQDMVDCGYALEPIQFSVGERIHFYSVDWPVNLARMLAWRALEAVKDQVGRSPRPHTVIAERQSARV